MTRQTNQRTARLSGWAYLGIIATGLFAEFFVRMSLVEADDAAATLANIAGQAQLFRAGLAADAIMVALDIAVAVGLYALLRPVDRTLAALAAAFRLIQAAVLAANLGNMASALQWATAGAAGGPPSLPVAETMTLASLQLHRVVYDLGLIFFGLACLVLGHLLRVSRLVPTLIAVGLSVAGVVYLLGSFTVVLAPTLAQRLEPMYALTLAAELAFALRLVTKGVREPAGAPPTPPAARA